MFTVFKSLYNDFWLNDEITSITNKTNNIIGFIRITRLLQNV